MTNKDVNVVVAPLQNWRKFRGLNQEELAEMVGLSKRTIAEYERSPEALRRASYDTLKQIASALDITPDNIFL